MEQASLQTNQPVDKPALTLHRKFPVAPEKVWRAWTDPQALSSWFGASKPGAVTTAEIALRVGGRYRIVTQLTDGGTNDVSGEYQEVVPHKRLVFTWAWRSTPDRVSRVSIDLLAQDGGTTMRLVHDRFFDEQARVNHERGWTTGLAHIEALLQRDQ
jgi:uncharacterized protein YndB with AHSA1/START domain